MAKIKLSELKLKSSVIELNQEQRKATKGGYFDFVGAGDKTKIVDTGVDIRFHSGNDRTKNNFTDDLNP